jgi:hypothetical protein
LIEYLRRTITFGAGLTPAPKIRKPAKQKADLIEFNDNKKSTHEALPAEPERQNFTRAVHLAASLNLAESLYRKMAQTLNMDDINLLCQG